jgi:hypothetical protein
VVDIVLGGSTIKRVTDPTELTVSVTVQADATADDGDTAVLRDYVRSMLAEHEFDVTDHPTGAELPAGAKGQIPRRSVRWSWRWRRPAVS